MDPAVLNEYRCECGRLLFKGVLLNCNLEIKCKKCGKINIFRVFSNHQIPASFTFTINESGIITDACHGAEAILDYSLQELVGKPVADICPLLNDAESHKKIYNFLAVNSMYKIKNNRFIARDGGVISPESYCIGRRENGAPAGYYIFNWVPNNSKSA